MSEVQVVRVREVNDRCGAEGPPFRRTRGRLFGGIAWIGMSLALGCLVAGAAMGQVSIVPAEDVYVDNTNPGCSDAGPGSMEAPYCTISAALAAHHLAGTTINVLPGIYRERITVPASGAPRMPLILRALSERGRPVVIDGADDFSSPSLWAPYQGDVWVASSVSWSPFQVFAGSSKLSQPNQGISQYIVRN